MHFGDRSSREPDDQFSCDHHLHQKTAQLICCRLGKPSPFTPNIHRQLFRTLHIASGMSAKQQLQASLAHIDKTMTTKLHSRLSTIHANDANITKQTKTLQAQTHEASKQQDHWDNIVRAGRNGLKVSYVALPAANHRTLAT